MNNFCKLAARLNNVSIILQWLLIFPCVHIFITICLQATSFNAFLSFGKVALIFKLIMPNDFRTDNCLWHICFHFLRFPEKSKGVSSIYFIHYLHGSLNFAVSRSENSATSYMKCLKSKKKHANIRSLCVRYAWVQMLQYPSQMGHYGKWVFPLKIIRNRGNYVYSK